MTASGLAASPLRQLPASRDPRPLCVDLFCGYGGWAHGFLDAGYRVIGYDNNPECAKHYPGEFVCRDLRTGIDIVAPPSSIRVVVASPPCNYYSKLSLPKSWGRGWKPDDGGKLWDEAERIVKQVKPWAWCIENVRGAEKVRGKATARVGSRYLWGDFPIINPKPVYGKWRLPPSKDRTALRSMIPYPLSRALAEACYPWDPPEGGGGAEAHGA